MLQLTAGPEMRPEPTPPPVVNDELKRFGNVVNRVEFTAPLNQTRTTPAETPQESSKIQNEQPAQQERVPVRATKNNASGIDLTLANRNLLNDTDKQVSTPVLTESFKQKPKVLQQRVPKIKPNRDRTVSIAVVSVAAAAIGTVMYIQSS